ncbi:Heavy metal transport/detoxification protein (fragment) [Imperialibacter sp. EC-SDR9]
MQETKGVLDNHVEYPGDIAIIKYDDKKTKPSELIAAIEKKTSYKATLYIEPREKDN